ncbi:MAG: NADPH2:quinone reductase [Candidatus Azotimanducaceae bacterium]|jgi:NADPH2:quinone reductase
MAQQQQLRSTVTSDGHLKLDLARIDVPVPTSAEVVVRIEASPINPSDLGLLFGMADMSSATASGTGEAPVITADIAPNILKALQARIGKSLPVGNEGGGVVVAAGDSELAQSMLGKTVSILGGAMYTQFRCVTAKQCLVMPEGTTSAEAASCFVNPLTALGMTETMKAEGHTALVHTAAASNLGLMLNKICIADGIQLVNIVRKQEQVDALKAIGAKHVCDTSDDDFMHQLTNVLVETGATIAFDATGGGPLAGQILTAMERAAMMTAKEYSGYGSSVHKQVYIYGGLDRRTTELSRAYGMAWSVGGWLLTPFLKKIGFDAAEALRQRVANEIKTTFASTYTAEVSLAEALTIDAIKTYGKQATGEKYLINPNKGV